MKNTLSPLYKFLIYLEEIGTINVSTIESVDKKSLRGVMGKMEAMGLTKKTGVSVALSDRGYEFLNSILDAIHKPTVHWDGKWKVIYFSTPENIRSRRDKFRRDIEGYGFRPIIKGLWFSPVHGRDTFNKIVKSNKMEDMAVYLETNDISDIGLEKVSKSWKFDSFRKDFELFIDEAQKFLSSKKKDRLETKRLIFTFAMILNNEPQVPIELLPRDWPKYRAKLMYKRLKNLIAS